MIRTNLGTPINDLLGIETESNVMHYTCTKCFKDYTETMFCALPSYKPSIGLCPNCYKRTLSERELTEEDLRSLAQDALSYIEREPAVSLDIYFNDCLSKEQIAQVSAKVEQIWAEQKTEAKKQLKEEYKKKAIEVCKEMDVEPTEEQLPLVAAILRYVDTKSSGNFWDQRFGG